MSKKTINIIAALLVAIMLTCCLMACSDQNSGGNKDNSSRGNKTGNKAKEATVGLEFELLDDDTYGVKGYDGTAKQVFISKQGERK